jgi:hypothetical protein
MAAVAVLALALLGIAGWLQGQPAPLKPEVLLLARIKVRAAENLEKLPNYTCLETIERSRRRIGGRRFELVDVLRLEVGFVDHKEVYAWPGSGKFEDKPIHEMVSGGAIGNGSFALHVRGIFLGGGATFTHVGEHVLNERSVIRYDYDVPNFRSGYRIRVRPQEGVAAYRGSIYVDPRSLDLVRLAVNTYDIPPHVPVASTEETLDYARVPIGEQTFLLPQSSEMVIRDLQGSESRNRLRFTQCRQFAGESVLRFADADELDSLPSVAPPPPSRVTLPADLDLDLKLNQPIDTTSSAIGDQLTATVARDVKRKGVLLIPKGARVTGRLVKMERRRMPRMLAWAAGVEFTHIEWANSYADLHVELVAAPPTLNSSAIGQRTYTVTRETPANPQTGILYIRGETGKIPAGTRTAWRTLAPIEELQ